MSDDPAQDPIVEMLARMWITVDPNRQGDPDEIITMHEPERQVPRWHWFIPRAQGTLEYLDEHGYELVPRDTSRELRAALEHARMCVPCPSDAHDKIVAALSALRRR
jgi:hypothetical protein